MQAYSRCQSLRWPVRSTTALPPCSSTLTLLRQSVRHLTPALYQYYLNPVVSTPLVVVVLLALTVVTAWD